jgi:hypothetical protein
VHSNTLVFWGDLAYVLYKCNLEARCKVDAIYDGIEIILRNLVNRFSETGLKLILAV